MQLFSTMNTKTLLRFVCLFLLCCHSFGIAASNDRLYRTDKISSNLFSDIDQDSVGYIWIATEYGLNRFDGARFQYFFADGKEGSLNNNNVRRLKVDRQGALFVATDFGLQKFDHISKTFIEVYDNKGESVKVADMFVDGKALFILTNDGKIFIYDTESERAIEDTRISSKLPEKLVARRLFIDKKRNFWIGTLADGIYRIDRHGDNLKHFSTRELPDVNINGIVATADGTIYVATSVRIWRHDRKSDSFTAVRNESSLSSVREIIVTNDDMLLVGTYGHGLFFVDVAENVCKPISRSNVSSLLLNTVNVTAFHQDRDKNLWIGCFYDGLLLIPQDAAFFQSFRLVDLPINNSRALSVIQVDEGGKVWIGQESNGLFQLDANGAVVNHYIGKCTPLSVVRANDGRLRVGLYDHGVAIVNSESGEVVYDKRFGFERIKSIVKSVDGTLYYAVFNGGIYKDSPADKSLTVIKPHYSKAINKLYLDSDSLIWLGHYNGVECYDPKSGKFIELPQNNKLKNSICYAIYERQGELYFGTSIGLFVYNKKNKTYSLYTTKDGLSNEVVCGIAEDDFGDIWLSTYRGLTSFTPETKKFTQFFAGNGIESTSFLRTIYTQDNDGFIYFGNDHSYIRFSPSRMNVDAMKNELLLTRLVIHRNATDENLEKDYVTDIPIEKAKRFTLSHKEDVFTMYFSTLNFGESDNMQLQYRLNDANQWYTTEPGEMRIDFTRMPSGVWTIEVRAINNGYVSETQKYIVEVTPPWYISRWAVLSYVVFVLLSCLWLIKMWVQRQRDANNEAKLRFFIDLAHEFRSPITLMLSPLQSLLKKENDPATARALRNMYRNASRMMQLLNQILDIRKIDKGQMKIKCVPTDIVTFTKEVCHVFDYEADKRKCKLTFASTAESVMVWIDRNHFDKILYNLLSNAFKFVPDEGTIDVGIVLDPTPRNGFPEGAVQISVTDSGPGIDEQQMKQIFERFYQVSPRSKQGAGGYGIGLNLTKQLVALHHGHISVENRADGLTGARFTVVIPLGNRLLHQDQISTESNVEATPVHTLQTAILSPDSDKLKYIPKKTNFHIVVVDDDDEIRNYLKTELHPYYHVKVCQNGKEALKLIMSERPDLVISDVVMPEMDGYELLWRIKTSTETSSIPVILLTSNADINEKIVGLRKGADAYLEKPFNIEELLARISGLIANRRLVKGKFSGAQEQKERVEKVVMKDVDDELMESIMAVLNANVDNPDLNVEMLSSKVGISRAQLHRRMKEITGIACGEFIRNFRLKHAAELLSEGGNIYVAQVAYACGFSNPTNFSTTFKKHYGVSPSEYIESQRNKNDEQNTETASNLNETN